MLKKLFKTLDFKLNNVFGLPTIYGLVLAAFLMVALWYSVINNSSTERWIFILMLFVCLVNLLETSYPFRMIEVKVLPIDPPFSEEITLVNLEIENPAEVRSGLLWVKLGSEKWTEVESLKANSSQMISLKVIFKKSGLQAIPKIRIKTYADSGMYRYWKIIDPKMYVLVLPRPVDHKIMASAERSMLEDNDLAGFEEILDPSRFRFADPKLFQKTNRRYQRIFQSRRFSSKIFFRWADLQRLSHQQKGEQFSFWIKSIAALQGHDRLEINLEAPFIKLRSESYLLDLTSLKLSFARWFYAQV